MDYDRQGMQVLKICKNMGVSDKKLRFCAGASWVGLVTEVLLICEVGEFLKQLQKGFIKHLYVPFKFLPFWIFRRYFLNPLLGLIHQVKPFFPVIKGWIFFADCLK